MEDLLAAVLEFLLECLVEVLIEFAMGLAADVTARAIRRTTLGGRRIGPALSTFLVALAGFIAGFASVWIFPHPFVRPSRFHGVSLIISPLVTGILLALLGQGIRRRGKESVAIESFRYGFVFALAIAIVRFAFASHLPVH
ncbi:MAG TPA: hypothetical protein VKB38_14075 [Terracidiphilus sp.]|nr:hypothetical protein [Terracidiphilus sp.]